jgi:hypothetical protein
MYNYIGNQLKCTHVVEKEGNERIGRKAGKRRKKKQISNETGTATEQRTGKSVWEKRKDGGR